MNHDERPISSRSPKKFSTSLQLSIDNLREHCVFCEPWLHGQQEQILLRSDNFYLFAGLGPIVEGYIIITPYRCDDPQLPMRSLAEAPTELIDEMIYLRGLISSFYRDHYNNQSDMRSPGMHFEHGRTGVCLPDLNDTKHCYHAHLCCYPVSFPLWEDLGGLSSEELEGLHELEKMVGDSPYLFVQACVIDESKLEDSAERETWPARVVKLKEDVEIQSQYLRRLLVKRARAEEEFRWDWLGVPDMSAVRRLIHSFQDWLKVQTNYVISSDNDHIPRLDFIKSVCCSNEVGNNYIAEKFYKEWGGKEQFGAIGRFLKWLPDRRSQMKDRKFIRPRVLDAGCGPGAYLNAFYHMGIECVGIDISDEMLLIARNLADSASRMYKSHRPCPPPKIEKMNAFEPDFEELSFDGIWYSAVFVHVPKKQAWHTLTSLRRILRDDGVLYLSVQIGSGSAVRWEGRVFFYYTEEEMLSLFRKAGFKVVEEWRDETNTGSCGDTRKKNWKHYLLKKLSDPIAALLLSDLGERGILEHIKDLLPKETIDYLVLGIGDDCAALKPPADELLVVTTDPTPRTVISMLEKGNQDYWYDGWFSMLINLSDLGAMGAKPLGILLSVEAEESMTVRDLSRFYEGILSASRRFDCPVIGGNLKDAVRFNCVGTALGSIHPQRMMKRDAARPGEKVVVLGEMGMFWAGVLYKLEQEAAKEKKREPKISLSLEEEEVLLENLKRPIPRITEGRALADNSLSRCVMDSSDGLIACFYEVARAGQKVDLHIDLSEVSPHPLVRRVADEVVIDARKLMLSWGDWELVCTVADDNLDRLRGIMSKLNCRVSIVGSVTDGNGQVWFHDTTGTGPLTYLASERFTKRSYFSHGLESYLAVMRQTPLSGKTEKK